MHLSKRKYTVFKTKDSKLPLLCHSETGDHISLYNLDSS